MLFQPFIFFGDNAFGNKTPNGVQRWKHLRRFITLYNSHIYTDKEEEERSESEDEDD